ncbi:MAG: cellulase family glycosylhydrolase [Planctomycetaceae bacterium]|nr:cellulase family glycosylhydrolase [Planctomycetales bacterium]MCB9921312.1 cellulase family glycosylhydrolase [Planctomycetaceae bacterium]
MGFFIRRCLQITLFAMTLAYGADWASAQFAGDENRSALFPFMVSYDSPGNLTNLSSWLDAPAGKHGHLRVQDGHFFTDNGPIRFWGTNLCFEACFPTHEQAERLAARLARFGINIVRMHHMDSRSIWGDSGNHLTIDPKQLERLDYLIDQLKQRGIYTNLNLHVSRSFGPNEGFVAQQQRPNYDKGLDNFEPRMIELQRRYAHDLLTHVNPYTKLAYTADPAIAFVEINNENALFDQWSRGELDRLPEPYITTFREQWNAWLTKKYKTTESLRKRWDAGTQPLGAELLKHYKSQDARSWHLETDDVTDAELSVAEAPQRLRIVVRRQGRETWRPQLTQSGFAVERGRAYTLSFSIRTNREQHIVVNCMMAHDPWQRLGLEATVSSGPTERTHHLTFLADRDDENARITFTGLKPDNYELFDVSLRTGGISGLAEDESLETGSVSVMRRGNLNQTAAAREDFIDFLWHTEHDYWTEFEDYLKEQLGIRALVSGTQLGYSPVHVQAELDYIDAHAYWQHPSFPNRDWDRRDWYVNNVALVNARSGTLESLANRRVAGMPFTVSEYNHPFPNAYAAEGFPMIAAMGAFQSWDGIYSFAYSHDNDFEPDHIKSYFDIKCQPTTLIHMPASVALFVRGDLMPANAAKFASLTRDREREQLHATGDPWSLTADRFMEANPFVERVGMELRANLTPAHDTSQQLSQSQQIRLDRSQPGAGYFVADTERTKVFSGFVRKRVIRIGNVAIRIQQPDLDWATVSMVCMNGTGFDRTGRILIAANGIVRNSDAKTEDLGNNRITLRDQWGKSPILCEGINAEISLPVAASRANFYALDGRGERRSAISVRALNGRTVLPLQSSAKTLWYEVEIR